MRRVSFPRTFLVLYWRLLQGCPREGSKHSASSDAPDRPASRRCVAAAVFASAETEKFNSARDSEKNRPPCTLTALCVILIAITPLVSCFCDLLTALSHSCCLRCSKVIVTLPDHECGVVKNVHCNCCSKSRKSCDSVCETLMKHRV